MEIHKLPDLEFVFGHAGIGPLVLDCPRANDPQRGRLEQRGRRQRFLRNIANWQRLKDFQDTGNSDVPSSLTWPRSHFFDGIEPPAQVRRRSLVKPLRVYAEPISSMPPGLIVVPFAVPPPNSCSVPPLLTTEPIAVPPDRTSKMPPPTGWISGTLCRLATGGGFPSGYYVTWSGQFEYLERAMARLQVVVRVTVLVIFLLLYLNFRRMTETMMVMLSVPFALVGGIWRRADQEPGPRPGRHRGAERRHDLHQPGRAADLAARRL